MEILSSLRSNTENRNVLERSSRVISWGNIILCHHSMFSRTPFYRFNMPRSLKILEKRRAECSGRLIPGNRLPNEVDFYIPPVQIPMKVAIQIDFPFWITSKTFLWWDQEPTTIMNSGCYWNSMCLSDKWYNQKRKTFKKVSHDKGSFWIACRWLVESFYSRHLVPLFRPYKTVRNNYIMISFPIECGFKDWQTGSYP